MKSMLKILASTTFVITITMVLLYHLDRSGFFNIKEVQVEIKSVLEQSNFSNPRADELEKKLMEFSGSSLWSVDISKVSALIKKQEWVESFHIKRNWPHRLSVEVTPEKIYFLILNKDLIYPVIKNSQLLTPIPSSEAPDVPILMSEIFYKRNDLRLKAISLFESIPDHGVLSRRNIAEFTHNTKDGLVAYILPNQTKIKFGEDNFSLKAQRASQVLEYLEFKKIKSHEIDTNLSKKVLVKKVTPASVESAAAKLITE